MYLKLHILKKSSTFARRKEESCLSGRKSRTRNAVYAQAYRGFESPTFRLNTKIEADSLYFPFNITIILISQSFFLYQEFRFRQKLSRYFTNKQSLVQFSHQRESDIHHMGEVVLTFFGSSGFACQNIIRHSTNHQRLIARASCIHVQCWRLHLNS